jgi:hypothetical protein
MKLINKLLFGVKKSILFVYDPERMSYHALSKIKIIISILIILSTISFASILYGKRVEKHKTIKSLTEYEKMIIIKETDIFNKSQLIELLKDLNVKFPHIVMAQSIIETGHWSSHIFYVNHNLFGMKEALRRVSTAKGTARNHAYYNHWRESVYDYAFYQCRYLGRIESEAAYFEYLAASYAEAPNYVSALKAIIKNEKLKDLFNE